MLSKTLLGIKQWLPEYIRRPRAKPSSGLKDILLCVCDHFEPFHGTDRTGALKRVDHWSREFPKMVASFRDSDGVGPRHTFFYPIEQYDRDVMTELSELCGMTGAEVEVHLHHDRDTAENLRATLERGRERLTGHGLLSRDSAGKTRYGFIHGNWALDNSHPDGCDCGVSNELAILGETGCYADFTMPSSPDLTQTRTINSLYYALDTPEPKSHDRGVRVRVLPDRQDPDTPVDASLPAFGNLLLIQGPLCLNWENRKFGVLPRVETGDLTTANPPRLDRLRLWLDLGISVMGRPEWIFVKLHTHGGIASNYNMLLGEPMRQFHELLASGYNDGLAHRLHYVSAREMVNILHAAEDGKGGNPGEYRNYRYRLAGAPVTA